MASSAAPDGPRPVQGCVAFARRPAPTSAPPRLLSHVAGSPYPCADKELRDRRRGGAESPSVGLRYRQPLSPQHMAYRLMEEVLDKLQLLDYEKKFCEERNEPALTKTAFAVANQNPRHAARRWPTSPPAPRSPLRPLPLQHPICRVSEHRGVASLPLRAGLCRRQVRRPQHDVRRADRLAAATHAHSPCRMRSSPYCRDPQREQDYGGAERARHRGGLSPRPPEAAPRRAGLHRVERVVRPGAQPRGLRVRRPKLPRGEVGADPLCAACIASPR